MHLLNRSLPDIPAVKGDLAPLNPAVSIQQSDDTHGRHALAAAGLSHNPQGLAGLQGIAYVIDSLYGSLFSKKIQSFFQMAPVIFCRFYRWSVAF